MGIKDKFSIFVYIAVALVLMAGSLILIPSLLERDNFKTHKIEKTNAIAENFNKLIENRLTALRALAINKPVVYKILKGEMEMDSGQSRCLLGTSRLITEADIVYVLDTLGTVVGCSVDDSNMTLIGNNYKFREYFVKAMEGIDVIYPALGVTTLKKGLYLSRPIIDDITGKPIGVVVIKIGLEQFEEIMTDFDGYISLVSPEGIIFACNNKDWVFKTLSQLEPAMIDSLLKSRQYGDEKLEKLPFFIDTEHPLIDGKEYHASKVASRINGWQMISCFESKNSYPLTAIQKKILFWAFLLEALLLTFAVLLLFNIMKKKEIETKLREERENLDRKVKERTKELSDTNEKLIESLDHFETIFNTSPDITTLTNMQTGRLVNVNEHFTSILGFKKEEVTNRPVIDLWKNPEHRKEFAKQLKENGACYNYESEFTCKDGRIINGIVSAKVLELNRVPHIIAITKDVTSLKENEKERDRLKIELEHSQRLQSIGTLAAGIAHEINSPLQFTNDNIDFITNSYNDIINLVNTYKSLMMACHTDYDKDNARNTIFELEKKINLEFLTNEMPDALSQTKDGIARIRKIVNAMKQYSHMHNEEKKPANINETVENAEIITRNEWKSHADVENNFAQDLPFITCYEPELNQVFMNLIVNAAHTTKDAVDKKLIEKGRIEVSTSLIDNKMRITIKDNGLGIPKEIKDRVYDPFFTTKDVGKGTGQGLAMAYRVVVEKHGGKIWFETEQNKGTTFFVEVPV